MSDTVSDRNAGSVRDPAAFIRLIAYEALRASVSVGIALIVFLTFFHRPIVVLDIKDLVGYAQSQVMKLPQEEAEKRVAQYITQLRQSTERRKEIIMVKDAVINPETLRNITDEFKK